MNTAPAPLITSNSDDTDPFYEPSDMSPMGPDEVGTWAIAFALVLAFAMTFGAALVVRWLLS